MSASPVRTAVVYVHGLWFSGHEGFLLQRRVCHAHPWDWHAFPYASTLQPMAQVADALAAFVAAIDAPEVHLVGHSLGGIAIQRCLERHPALPPGRVVLLGTPSLASRAATSLARWPFGGQFLGTAAEELLGEHAREWRHDRPLGIIAGTHSLSISRLVVHFDEPNDGTVSVEETRLPGAGAHLVLPVSHTGMLLDARVAEEVGAFLSTGSFTGRAA